ncbi:MAG TPA: helix-turn-helix domain-containing protein [Solirubrobacterales bacterium]|nr:helix-turn-helix domain-containing protein [Solirubrobacterales bacterium]
MNMLEPKQARSHATRQRLLDAAVQVLVEEGYAGISASTVARRAGVSRGAHQHHFANRQTLVIESVRHMSARELNVLHERIGGLPQGESRVGGALDFIFEMYSGTFFAAILELSLAARREPELKTTIAEEERSMSLTVQRLGVEILGDDALEDPALGHRWTTAIATIRGLAVLRLLRHSQETIDRQWRHARGEIIESLMREHVDAASS